MQITVKKIKLVLDIHFVTANRVAAYVVLYPDTWPSYTADYRYIVCDHSSKNGCSIIPCGSLSEAAVLKKEEDLRRIQIITDF